MTTYRVHWHMENSDGSNQPWRTYKGATTDPEVALNRFMYAVNARTIMSHYRCGEQHPSTIARRVTQLRDAETYAVLREHVELPRLT